MRVLELDKADIDAAIGTAGYATNPSFETEVMEAMGAGQDLSKGDKIVVYVEGMRGLTLLISRGGVSILRTASGGRRGGG